MKQNTIIIVYTNFLVQTFDDSIIYHDEYWWILLQKNVVYAINLNELTIIVLTYL